MPFSTKVREASKALANRRIERVARRRLSDELASFQTPAERAELEHILGRYSADETREIRDILNHQNYQRQRAATVSGGRPV